MFLNIGIQLYTVPIALRLLGQSDYGLYNVIGGVTALLAFVGSSLASGSQRFFAFAIGAGDKESLGKIFKTTNTIYFLLSIILLVIFETVGLWFVNEKMVFPSERLYAVNWVYQLSILAFLVSIQSIPYNAIMIAREDMNVWAYVGVISNAAKLGGVILLTYINNVDYLIFYAAIMVLVEILDRAFYQIYCNYKYEESRGFKLFLDKKLTKEMLTFSGFNMLGSLGTILQKQGINVVMNLFFGALLNAAHGIALQVQNVLEQLIHNISVAARPQITKYYAQGEIDEMWTLVYRTSLLAYYLLMMVGVIALIEMDTFFHLWLGDVPDYTVFIARCFIVSLLIETTANRMNGVFVAYNKMKQIQLYTSTICLLNVPVAYIALKFFFNTPYTPYIIGIIISIIHAAANLLIAKKVVGLDLLRYLKNVILREVLITIVLFLLAYSISSLLTPSFLRIVFTGCVVVSFSVVMILVFGLSSEDRKIVVNMIKCRLSK